jgi:hypothetical protein
VIFLSFLLLRGIAQVFAVCVGIAVVTLLLAFLAGNTRLMERIGGVTQEAPQGAKPGMQD